MEIAIKAVAFTDKGLVRERNEDCILIGTWFSQADRGIATTMTFTTDSTFVCAVADGMGGHSGGQIASRLTLTSAETAGANWNDPNQIRVDIVRINQKIVDVGRENLALRGLGTTLAGISVSGDGLHIFNVGDSRIYCLDDGFVEQLSVDDSILDAAGNPSNVVTQSIGDPSGQLEPHITSREVSGRYLICSDGVSGFMSAAELRSAGLKLDLEEIAGEIIATVRENGAADNFSLLLVEVAMHEPIGELKP